MTTHHALQELGFVEKWIAPRWKAIAAVIVPLVGGLIGLSAAGNLDAGSIWTVIGSALVSGGVVHQVPNKPAAVLSDVEDLIGGNSAAPGLAIADSGVSVAPMVPTPAIIPAPTPPDDDAPGA